MAETIKRAGPPKATDLKGEEFTWTVPLSEPPTRDWSRLFSEPAETTVLCHPRKVGMMHQALVFKCEEANLPVWIQHIDKWIAGANQALSDHEQREKQKKTEQLRQDEERKRRIDSANEKFKRL